jgi:hypothetical protein
MWENLAPVLIIFAFVMIPIVKILTRHQQQMATILRSQAPSEELEQIRRELAELRSLVYQQTIALDGPGRTIDRETVRAQEVR